VWIGVRAGDHGRSDLVQLGVDLAVEVPCVLVSGLVAVARTPFPVWPSSDASSHDKLLSGVMLG
jgi:hypothetical protein